MFKLMIVVVDICQVVENNGLVISIMQVAGDVQALLEQDFRFRVLTFGAGDVAKHIEGAINRRGSESFRPISTASVKKRFDSSILPSRLWTRPIR